MRIAIVKLSALGDIVHSMIVLQFIKQNIPNSKIGQKIKPISWFLNFMFGHRKIFHSLLFSFLFFTIIFFNPVMNSGTPFSVFDDILRINGFFSTVPIKS